MEKPRDIIIVGLQPWDISIGSNCKNIAVELAKNNRVLYVNSPLDRSSLRNSKQHPELQHRIDVLNKIKPQIEQVENNLWVYSFDFIIESINWLPNILFDAANYFNNQKIAKALRKVIKELQFSDYILFNDSDMFRSYHLKELLQPQKYIYYRRDNLMTVDYWRKHGADKEPKLISKSDIILANSPYLAEESGKFNTKSFYIGQGCDTSEYTATIIHKTPEDIKQIPGKIIGYVGLISSRRLDISLIGNLAKYNPEWSIVLIGPEESCFKESNLHNLENVFFLGTKKPSDLPAYINSFDVCINPQVNNELTMANYPRKIDEYLAMGKPVVATYTKTMEIFKDHVFLAQNSGEFIEHIQRSLIENNESVAQNRITFAQSHNWENCIKELWIAINNN